MFREVSVVVAYIHHALGEDTVYTIFVCRGMYSGICFEEDSPVLARRTGSQGGESRLYPSKIGDVMYVCAISVSIYSR